MPDSGTIISIPDSVAGGLTALAAAWPTGDTDSRKQVLLGSQGDDGLRTALACTDICCGRYPEAVELMMEALEIGMGQDDGFLIAAAPEVTPYIDQARGHLADKTPCPGGLWLQAALKALRADAAGASASLRQVHAAQPTPRWFGAAMVALARYTERLDQRVPVWEHQPDHDAMVAGLQCPCAPSGDAAACGSPAAPAARPTAVTPGCKWPAYLQCPHFVRIPSRAKQAATLAKLEAARTAFSDGDLAGTLAASDVLTSEAPACARGHYYAAIALRQAEEFNAAYERATLAASLQPNEPDFHAMLSALALDLERTALAVHHAGIACRLAPDDVLALENLAVAFEAAGRPRDALLAYDRIIELDPGNIDAHEDRASLIRSL